MNSKIYLVILIGVLALLTACAQPEMASISFDEAMATPAMAEEAPSEPGFEPSVSNDDLRVNLQGQADPQRLIIRSGDLSIVVQDSEASAEAIAGLAVAHDGWLVASDLYESNGVKRGSVTIRIPAERFDAAIAEIKSLALEVRTETTSSQDVTEEFVDLESRLANLEATADRVRAFLDESRNVEEALEVNRELSRLESEIEVIKGRMKYLSQSAAFSAITVTLIPDELSQPIEIGGWQPEGVAKDAIEALISALQGLANVVIWGGIFCLPLLLLVGLPLFFIGRYIYRRRRAGRAAEAEAESLVLGDDSQTGFEAEAEQSQE